MGRVRLRILLGFIVVDVGYVFFLEEKNYRTEEFLSLLFLHDHRDASALAGELPEESVQFRFYSNCLFD